jgi:glucosamine-6-phosphate deaminase
MRDGRSGVQGQVAPVGQVTLGQGDAARTALLFDAPEAMGACVARVILDGVQAARAAGRAYLLGCPTGRTPMPTYRAIGRQAAADGVDLSGVVLAMMDDYVVPAGDGFGHCPAGAHYSCRRAATVDIAGAINQGVPPACRLAPDHIWFPDPARPHAYDERLKGAGGIDFFLTASGASDGHVAFNAPGSALDSISRIVPLAETTRRDNLGTFPDFKGLHEVPTHGVSIGLGSIRCLSRQVALLMHGAGKREAVKRLNACRGFDPAWPASFIFECGNALILIDQEAMRE